MLLKRKLIHGGNIVVGNSYKMFLNDGQCYKIQNYKQSYDVCCNPTALCIMSKHRSAHSNFGHNSSAKFRSNFYYNVSSV